MATVKILNSSVSVEWFTPARYADAVRAVLGGIELDPASCAEANETIQAERYFSADGLAQSWAARSVFVNPPYGTLAGKSNQALWSRNLITWYKTGLTKSAILLVNASTSEKWWQPLWEFPICFPDHRIRFAVSRGSPPRSQPTKGQGFIYFGPNVFTFGTHFAQFGPIIETLSIRRSFFLGLAGKAAA